MAQPRTGPSQVVRCDCWQTAAFRVSFHNCPDHLGRKAVSPDSACLVDGPQQWTCIDARAQGPAVDRFLYPFRNGNRPDMAMFSSQVCGNPMTFPKLEILESQGCHFSPPEVTTDEKREKSTIALTAKSLSSFHAKQLPAFFRGQPISDTHSQPPDTFYAPYACRKVRTEEYDHAICEFIDWYCSEPRLAFNKTVVTRYRIALEQRQYAPSTINLRLAAVRRLAYEALGCGLLSPDLAAGIR